MFFIANYKCPEVEKCKAILIIMRSKGMDVCDASSVDKWNWEEIQYFLANYEEAYL